MPEGISVSGLSITNMANDIINSMKSSSTEEDEESTSSVQEILTELQKDMSAKTMTAQDIMDEYDVSLTEAERIVTQLKANTEDEEKENLTVLPNGATVDEPTPIDSTVSYHI